MTHLRVSLLPWREKAFPAGPDEGAPVHPRNLTTQQLCPQDPSSVCFAATFSRNGEKEQLEVPLKLLITFSF